MKKNQIAPAEHIYCSDEQAYEVTSKEQAYAEPANKKITKRVLKGNEKREYLENLAKKLKDRYSYTYVKDLPSSIIKALRIRVADYEGKDCYELGNYIFDRMASIWDQTRKFAPKDIDKHVDSLPDYAFRFGPAIRREFMPVAEEQDEALTQIVEISRTIRDMDTQFENKNTEIEKATKYAAEVEVYYEKLLLYIGQVKEKDAKFAMEALRMMHHPYMRVFGDSMKYTKSEDYYGGNLEAAIKNLHHIKTLKIKANRYETKQLLRRVELTREYELEVVSVRG